VFTEPLLTNELFLLSGGMSQYVIFLGVKGGWPAHKAENFTTICKPIV
jgi:hypothetical protein